MYLYMGKIGSIWLFGVFSQFYSIFWPKHGLSKVKNAGFYSIPAGSSDHVFGKKGQNVIFRQNLAKYYY